MNTQPPVYNIPAGLPFADTLAAGILTETAGDPLKLAQMRVFLPTRRACRVLRESFLRLTAGKPLLLPRMQPIGDIHDDEPAMLESLRLDEDILGAIAPAMPPLQRQILLARTIMAAPELGAPEPEQAMGLAAALARLLDQVHTEGKDIASLQHIVPGDEIHWQVTVKFLRVLSETWPTILAAEGMIDAADRRNRLMRALAATWRTNPPQGRVIVAGTTGSIPATADLLKVIASLPQGAVVLPGLDQGMDGESWDVLDDNHPQATLRNLLQHLDVPREAVKLWPAVTDDHHTPRRWLAA
ncbi:MAG: double-strand break repair protein AddB, partial [Alphaproteobacteria bacterium]|nr:double-strand break repair protein AddB [Alphaproteobacteria bacterium]